MSYIYEKKQSSDLFHDLKRMGRDNFSYEGAKALMEYLEEYAQGSNKPLEYDPIAYCCDFAEYADLEEVNKDGFEYKTLDDLRDNTTVIEFDGGLIVQAY
jgi:hypothetical protein